jgi:hypothetical protein
MLRSGQLFGDNAEMMATKSNRLDFVRGRRVVMNAWCGVARLARMPTKI